MTAGSREQCFLSGPPLRGHPVYKFMTVVPSQTFSWGWLMLIAQEACEKLFLAELRSREMKKCNYSRDTFYSLTILFLSIAL